MFALEFSLGRRFAAQDFINPLRQIDLTGFHESGDRGERVAAIAHLQILKPVLHRFANQFRAWDLETQR
jgi:hypothetical protein